MNGTDILLDTNICIYLLNGDVVLAQLLQNQTAYVSIITEMELYAYHGNDSLAIQIIDTFPDSVTIINIEEKVKFSAIKIRKESRLKLPDSIIVASALTYDIPLITANKRLRSISEIDLVLYEKT